MKERKMFRFQSLDACDHAHVHEWTTTFMVCEHMDFHQHCGLWEETTIFNT